MGRAAGILFLSALMWGCAGSNVRRDYDASVDFRRLKTYSWKSPTPQETRGDLADNSLQDARVRNAVDAALTRKGYVRGPAEGADFLISALYTTERAPMPERVTTGIGLGLGIGGASGGLGINLGSGGQEEVDRETLTIDALDPQSGKLMWRGFVRQPLEKFSDPKQSAAAVNATAWAILSQFPPKTDRR